MGIGRKVLWGVAVIMAVALVTTAAFAEDAKVSVTGVVSVTTNDAKAVTAVKITAKVEGKEVAYNVVLDDNGKKLAAENGKTVVASGTVAEKEGVKTLTVLEYKVAEPEKANK